MYSKFKEMRKIFIIYSILATLIVCINTDIQAQPQPGENGDSTPVGGQPLDRSAPVGSGLAILTALGIAYGVKKTLKRNNKKI